MSAERYCDMCDTVTDHPLPACPGMAESELAPARCYACFVDSEIGMTMGDTTVKQLPDGTWKATAPIGTLFGSEVEGECSGTGATKEAALEAMAKDRKNLNDSLWM